MTSEPAAPRSVVRAAVLAAVEGALLLAVCLTYLVRGATGEPADRATAVAGAAMGVAFALLLLVLARSLSRLRRAALTPVVLTQLIALPIAYGLLTARQWVAAVVTGVLALAVLALLFGAGAARDAFR